MRIHGIRLRTADGERLHKFYADILGFEAKEDGDGILRLFSDPDGDPLVTIEEVPEATPRPEFSTGLYHVAFLMPSRKELARLLTRLSQERYPLQGFADHGVSEAIYLADPDGNGIELYADRPRDQWSVRRGEIEMYTHPLDLDSLLSTLADSEEEWEGIHPETSVGHIHLQVSDVMKSGEFYHTVLGYDIVQKNFPGALFLSTGGYHHHVGINMWNSKGAPSPPLNGTGLIRFSVETQDLITLRHFQVQFVNAGVQFEEIPTHNNAMPSLIVHDPDGIEIEIVVQQRVLVN